MADKLHFSPEGYKLLAGECEVALPKVVGSDEWRESKI